MEPKRGTSSSNSSSDPHSPLRFHSPLRSDHGGGGDTPPYASPYASPDNSKALVLVDPAPKSTTQVTINRAVVREDAPPPPPPPPLVAGSTKVGGGGGGRRRGGAAMILKREDYMMKVSGLGFRLSEVILCLISFSVMAADKTQGWSGDSYDRYKEYRYCLAVNVIGFVYSGFQALDLAFYLIAHKHTINIHPHLRYSFDFFMDQILAYLLISASSAAGSRVVDWESNWGKDEFTQMASASVAMAFLAFIAFALSSLISGYNLFADMSSS